MKRRALLAVPMAAPAIAPAASLAQGAAPRRVHAISLLGEAALPADFPHWAWANPDAPKGGDVTFAAIGSFDSFNPYILRGAPAAGSSILYDTLTSSAQDEASTEYAHLAAFIELPADGLGVAFELRPEARWHDGRPITAADVVWTFETLVRQGRPFYRAYWGDVESVRAEGERRVVFRFKTNENRELAQVLGQMPVLPKHWWEGRDFSRPLQEAPLGSGPYKLERFESGRSVTYRRVEDYWARNLGTARGLNNFGSIRYEYFRDSTVAFEAFKAGQVDARMENVARDWATGYDFPAIRRGLVKREAIRHEIPTGMQSFSFNLRRPVFQDARVREALVQVFDFEWLNANIFFGSYARTSSYFSNSELASSGLPEGRELEILSQFRAQLPERLFTEPFRLPATDGSGNNREGLRRALDLLRQAGWTVRDRKLVNAQGQQFRFEILLDSATFERVALPYVQWLQRLGIEASVRTVDPAQYRVRMDAFDFDMTVDVMGQSLSPGNEQRDYFSCEKANEHGSQNVPGICSPVIDALVDQVINAPSREELIARTHALDRVLLWQHFVIPNWHSREFRLAWWDRFGRPDRNPRYGSGFPTSWWVDAAKDRALTEARR
ncbi:extracellular solute-binding protein [Rhodovarius lipocyclicus]|uniref:extracellular solute-binding protein n=1 Tax=Rhodovarius lipocyclicus TaxID=268410 RepID=UPI0013582B8A|nr:extracellular solute-binding protein [Rhodovarius lipocyclicus]